VLWPECPLDLREVGLEQGNGLVEVAGISAREREVIAGLHGLGMIDAQHSLTIGK
jgi:hypothetical protein